MKNIAALLWDFDGTIADSAIRNFNVTKKIITKVLSAGSNNFNALKSFENYNSAMSKTSNWRTFYSDEFKMTERQIDEAGELWTEFQLKDDTELVPYENVIDTINLFSELPMAIISQNSKQNILQFLSLNKIDHIFNSVIGYEEVGMKFQKPHPHGIILALEKLNIDTTGSIIYVGDHETDVELLKNASKISNGAFVGKEFLSIAYASPQETFKWKFKPDFSSNCYIEIKNYIINNYKI